MASTLQPTLAVSLKSMHPTRSLHGSRLPEMTNLQVCMKSTSQPVTRTCRTNKLKKSISSYPLLLHGSVSNQLLEARHASRLPLFRAQIVKFKARRQVSIPFREGALPAREYLKEVERVVKVTFPDSSRITYLGDYMWRSRLKSITFFAVSATPTCDIMVYNHQDTLRIHSDRLYLDFSGVPDEYRNLNLQFSLGGKLQANPKVAASEYRTGRLVDFVGTVSLGLQADLPLPISLIPDTLLTGVGDGILDTILGAMESELVKGIISDYHSWCLAQQNVESNRIFKVSA